MCGFFVSVNDTAADVRGLTDSIKHRGPDSTKYFFGKNALLGFNRLAIVDNDPLSDQPMFDSSGRYVLVFNGEIYNYKKLRADLEHRFDLRFRTHSDTEVLLCGLIREGASFAARLDGIYAFAFIDLESLEVVLARDVFGVKPLYYHASRDRLYVSSEIKPLRQLTGGSLDFASIARYLSYGVVGNGRSLVEGINELDPNTVAVFQPGKPALFHRIHNFEYDIYEDYPLDRIGATLFETVDSQKPDIPYGVLFSGGIDSTFILDRCADDPHFFGAYSVDVNHPEMSERGW
jgi:asparagine synthase (glutamine-hydrolysing)